MHLGDFGTDRPAIEDSFGYFGETVRVNPDLTDLVIFDAADLSDAETDPTAAVMRFVGSVVHPDDVDLFWQTSKRNRQLVDDVTTTLSKVIEAVTERPTTRPSDSSDGPQRTGTSSGDDSSSRALAALEGRPDLQLAVVKAQEARAV